MITQKITRNKLIKNKTLLLCLYLYIGCVSIYSQVTVSGSNPLSDGSYSKLSLAFSAINGQNQIGNSIIITITSNITTEDGGSSLGAGNWTNLLIVPSGNRSVSGSVSWGLIEFNGSDNVTIDGLNDGSNSLIFSNTSTSNGASTIKFYSDAVSNSVKNCTLLGSAGGDAATLGTTVNGGTLVISFSLSGGTGNDNISILNNNFGPAGATLPTCAIRGNNSTASWSSANSSIIVSGNNIYDYFSTSTYTSSGIFIGPYNTDWTIDNNRFYQTAARTQTSGKKHTSIFISPNWTSSVQTSAIFVNSFNITNNTFGFANSSSTGTYTINGTSNTIVEMIYLCVGDQGTSTTNIQGNTFANISLTGSQYGTGTSAPLKMINIYKGDVNIGTTSSNTFGSQSGNGSINFSTSSSSITNIYGILVDRISTGGAISIKNNNFGSITSANTNSTPATVSIYVISTGNTVNSNPLTIENNIIGGDTQNSIQNTSTAISATNCTVGIFVNATATNIEENMIRNLSSFGGNGTGSNGPSSSVSSVIGIAARNSYLYTISHNTIYSLSNFHPSTSSIITGIEFTDGANGSVVKRNMVRSLSAVSSSATINGINISNTSSAVNFENNMISLGKFEDGTDLTIGCNIYGINENSTTTVANNFYFNSIQIAGSGILGNQATYAFYSNKGSNAKKIINNIFYNKRSNGSGTGNHYSIRLVNVSSLTIDYNNYNSVGTDGILGRIGSTDYLTFPLWKAATSQDLNSITPFSPIFISDNDLHLQTTGNTPLIAAISISGIPSDIDPDVRLSTPTIGADEIITIISLSNSIDDFDIICDEEIRQINWSTVSENNKIIFSVQRSTDGYNFNTIQIIEGVGNSSTQIDYSCTDKSPIKGIIYYRLKQTDIDGSFSNSMILATSCQKEEINSISIFPNPGKGYVSFRSIQHINSIQVFNELGQLVIHLEELEKNETLDLNTLPNGFYSIQFITENGNMETKKYLKL